MMVSGRTIATTSRTDGNQRQSQTNRKRSVLLRCGRFGVRRRSTLTCCRRTRFSASSVALALKLEARIPRISLNRSVIRMRAYAVRLLRLRRIEFSVHTADNLPSIWLRTETVFQACTVPGAVRIIGTSRVSADVTATGTARGELRAVPEGSGTRCQTAAANAPTMMTMPTTQSRCRLDFGRAQSVLILVGYTTHGMSP